MKPRQELKGISRPICYTERNRRKKDSRRGVRKSKGKRRKKKKKAMGHIRHQQNSIDLTALPAKFCIRIFFFSSINNRFISVTVRPYMILYKKEQNEQK